MNSKRPYTHILINLFHEQATELIPLLLPGFQVEQVEDVEMPDIKSTYIERPPNPLEEGLVGLVMPEATVHGVYHTEWIEHSGHFERAYRVQNPETDKLTYQLFEFQTEREDKWLPRRLVANYATILRYTGDVFKQEGGVEAKGEHEYYVYPYAICPFPQSEPAHIHDTFFGKPSLDFNFLKILLWEYDAREMLNTHVSAIYFLLPVMKNADANLLGLAIEELAQRFHRNDTELGRHLTGLNMLLQVSELLSDEEKLAAQVHLQPFAHLIKDDTSDE